MKKFLLPGIFTILFLLSFVNLSAQTKGLIYKPATSSGQAVLDPNLDGYTSDSNQGFVANDESESEIPYTPLPSLGAPEPPRDLGPGPSCGFTDLVKSSDNHTIYTYLDANENLMFRFRLGGTAENSKAYSILIDTDEKFGATGPNADPNYIPGNPGFEIEVVLRTNFGVGLYDVDGTVAATEIGDATVDRPYNDFAQKSIAFSEICNDDDYFYDFYIPFADITAAFGITTSTPLRMVGNTVINPNEAIGNNGISDLGGADDSTGTIDNLWGELIDVFPPTSVSEIGTGTTLAPRANCPGIDSPIDINDTSISGTSDYNGATIELFRNGISEGTTSTQADGSWVMSGLSPALDDDSFSATVTHLSGDPAYSTSYRDCNETAVGTCTNPPIIEGYTSGSKGLVGTTDGPAGTVIRIYEYPSNTLWAGSADNPYTTVSDNERWVIEGGQGQSLPQGNYYATAQAPGQCESEISIIVCRSKNNGGTAVVPTISTSPIYTTATTISGTSGSGAYIELYIDGIRSSYNTTASGTTWTITGITGLTQGQSLIVLSTESGVTCPSQSEVYYVEGISQAPQITGDYCVSSGSSISAVQGISNEPENTEINVYSSSVSSDPNPTLVGTALVDATGNWALNGLNLNSGTFIRATAIAAGESESNYSNEIQILDQTSDAALAITSDPVTEGDASISGTGTSGNTVYLYLDGNIVDGFSATVAGDGTWTISGLDAASAGYDVLYAGAETGVTSKEGSLCESVEVTGPIVQCIPPAAQGFAAISPVDICDNETISFEINPTEEFIVYELIDQAGNPIGPAKIGNSSGAPVTLTTYPLSASANIISVKVKTQKVGIECDDEFGPAINISVNAVPQISMSNAALEVCKGETNVDLTYVIDANGPALDYSIDFDNDANLAGLTDVLNDTNVASPVAVNIPSDISGGIYNGVFTIRNSGSTACTSNQISFTIEVIAPEITSASSTDPSSCVSTNGIITLQGLLPSENYSALTYTDNGVTVNNGVFTTNASGEYQITGLDAGTYEDFVVEYNSCASPAFNGPVVLADPGAATIAYAGQTDPTNCDTPNGEIILSGVTSGNYTVNYIFGGSSVSQSITADGGGITIGGLQPGNYSQFYITDASGCDSNVLSGPISLANAGIPTITLGSNPSVRTGTGNTEFTYSGTSNSPDTYSIDFDAAAETEGFDDVSNSLSSSPISVSVPATAGAGVYNATFTVRNSTTGCVSTGYPVTITVTANTAPSLTNFSSNPSASLDYAENGTGNVIDWDATDAENDALSFTLSGADSVLFNLSADGILTFITAPDFEDSSSDNIHNVTITVSDGLLSDTQDLTINVTDVVEEANFTIDPIADATVGENSAYTGPTPALSGDTPVGAVTWTITGDDAADFTVDSNGVISMVARDFENPQDANTDNIYEVTLTATDADGNTDTEAWTVTVTDVTETSNFTIGTIANATVAENSAYTGPTPALSGDAPVGSVTWTITGDDAADFTVDSNGVISMVARDFENPQDANTDNIYEVTLTATDADGNTDLEAWTVTVTDVTETSNFTIDPIADATVAENSASTGPTPALSGDTPVGSVTWTITGDDAADFTVDSATGVVSMIARDFENPQDANTDNIYEVTLTSTDADGNTDTEAWTVTVTDVTETSNFTIDAIADATLAENSAYTGLTPTLSGDTPVGAVTWTITGADAADFTVDSNGVVSMVARDFENPQDANTNNIYELTLNATDADGNTASEAWTLTVTDVTETSNFTIDPIADATVAENSAYTGPTPALSGDTPVGSVTWTITGDDAADFTVDLATGVVSMVARDFENPQDANTDNIYEVTLNATDADGNTASEAWTVTVTDVTETSNFTVDAIADATVVENSAYTGPTPALSGDTPVGAVTWTITGADAADFTVDSATGVVSMVVRDFESPADANTNNIYEVTLNATDADGNTDTEAWTVTVTDVTETSNFTIDAIADATVAENSAYTGPTPALSGDTPVGAVSWTITGDDAADFSVDSNGVISMVARDFESPADANTNNIYEVTLNATDADGNTASEAWTVTVTDVVESAMFTLTPVEDTTVEENEVYTSSSQSVASGSPIGNLTYSITGGLDKDSFTINPTTGVVNMIARDFEIPADSNLDNIYEIVITATDEDGNTANEDWKVTVTDVNEGPLFNIDPVSNTIWDENSVYSSGDQSITGMPIAPVTWTISGGTDADKFTIDSATGNVTMQAKDFEIPVDSNFDNFYAITITATDNVGNTDDESWTVQITDVNEAPVITNFSSDATASIDYAENGTGNVIDWDASDVDGDVLTFTLSGADRALFDLDTNTGILTFKSSPNFEGAGDNVYEAIVTVSDGFLSDTQTLTVNVTNQNEAPVITNNGSAAIHSVDYAENGTGNVINWDASDVDGDDLIFTLSGADAALFDLDTNTGILTFKSSPDFEGAGDNIYEAIVTASDGFLSDTQTLTVNVTDENEAPVISNNSSAATHSVDYAENGTGNVIDWDASDVDGDDLTFTLSGADAALFDLDTNTGILTFKSSPDFEGAGGNIYEAIVTVSDGFLSDTQTLTVNVTDVNDTSVFYADTDDDGFGDASNTLVAETVPPGYVTNNTDCDDTDENEFPGQTWYLDADGDGYSDGTSVVTCERPASHFTAAELTGTSGDCNDSNAAINPGASEIQYDGIDNDCDPSTPDTVDADGDGVNSDTDCDDNNPAVNPNATEIPDNGIDDDCNPATLDSSADTDDDGDGQTENEGDCDDTNPAIYSGATEVLYDGIDNDCDPSTPDTVDADGDGVNSDTDCDDTDENEFPGQTWYLDADGDGYSDGTSVVTCERPASHFIAAELTDTTGDCNDSNAAINPDASEIQYDGIDNDCDPSTPDTVDADGDGVNSDTDCDDTDENEFPGQTWYLDADGDGYGDGTSVVTCERPASHFTEAELTDTSGDCNDSNAAINPDASEIQYDGIDNDCDPSTPDTVDADGDGVNSDTDCD
ncbi:MopE-related protein, partial [Christiangramia sabulilitoris]